VLQSVVADLHRAFKFAVFTVAVAHGIGCLRLWSQIAPPAHNPATLAEQQATEDRLRKSTWWPTKGSFQRSDFVGNTACAPCHAGIVAAQKSTSMARTATRAEDSQLLANYPLNYKLGSYIYQASNYRRSATYSVVDGTSSFSTTLKWAFGIRMGQSYLFEKNGGIYMAPLTYYPEEGVWDFTVDQPHSSPESLEKGIGRHLLDNEVRGCFNCHNTAATTSDRFDPEHSISGVTCEACHGPGAYHVASAAMGFADGATMILNPSHLRAVDSIDFCGSCHRTWWDITLAGGTGLKSLRFPPYRLENSRCWGKGDARLTCVACHDPHRPLVRDDAAYDEKCLSCHVNSVGAKPTADHPGGSCPIARKDCVSCHMPKYQVTDIPVKFTDHQIRVVRPNEPIPQ
jgi:hypothetical protein